MERHPHTEGIVIVDVIPETEAVLVPMKIHHMTVVRMLQVCRRTYSLQPHNIDTRTYRTAKEKEN